MHPPQQRLNESGETADSFTMILYALYSATFVTGFSGVVAYSLNRRRRGQMRGTYLESHFDWQMRTAERGLLGYLLAACTALLALQQPAQPTLPATLGALCMAVLTSVWVVYRLCVGFWRLAEEKPVHGTDRMRWPAMSTAVLRRVALRAPATAVRAR